MSDTNAQTKDQIERGLQLTPRFDANGLICAIAQDRENGEILMVAWMNAHSLALTLETGIAHYWSRSRGALWKKGETSGQLQTVHELRVDCDQDAVILRVSVAGDGGCCHVGFKSCFYRAVSDATGRLVQIQGDPAQGSHLTLPKAQA
jgi:phosphoribosyl-AMP cyclohydrolase